MTPEDELKMLKDCLQNNYCDPIVEQYWHLVCSVVRKTFVMKHAPMIPENLEEVYQEVFVQLFEDNRRRLRMYKKERGRSLAGWIVLIANHTALNYLRKKGYDSIWWQNRKTPVDETFKHPKNLETQVLNKLSVNKALKRLSHLDQIVFKLYRFGLPSKEIAVIVDSTEASINNRISKIKKKIRSFV